MSGLQEGLKGVLAHWQFAPAEAEEALAELLAAIRKGGEDTVRLVIADELSRGQLRRAQAILTTAGKDIKRATPISTEKMEARRKWQAAYQKEWQAKRKAERLLAAAVKGE